MTEDDVFQKNSFGGAPPDILVVTKRSVSGGLRTVVITFLLVMGLASAFPDRLYAARWCGDGDAEEEVSDRQLYLGLWTVHFRDLEGGFENNWLLGVAMERVYGATLVNSLGDRAYSAGFQDVLACWSPEALSIGLGYRVGVITGYDERFIRLAEKTPVIPFVQPRLSLELRGMGVELTYSGVVASAGFTVRF